MCYNHQSRETGLLQVSYLANDVDTSRTTRDKLSLSAVDLLEPRKELLPTLGLDRNRILWVDVA